MGGSTAPVVWAWIRESCKAADFGGNQHGFIAREDGLAKGNNATSIVDDTNVRVCALAVGFVWEWFRDGATVIAVETTVLDSSGRIHSRERRYTCHRLRIGV